MPRHWLILLVSCISAVPASVGQESLAAVLARLDQGASTFQSMTASLTWTSYTSVLQESDVSSGEVRIKRERSHPVGWIGFVKPDPKTVVFREGEVQIYYPKMKRVEIYDFRKYGDQLYAFLMLGFGTSAADLKRDYSMRVTGSDVVEGKKATRLELMPNSKEALEYLARIELWIPERSNYPIQEKLYQKSGDYQLIAYSDLQINPPLADGALKLELPPGVKKVYPQKQ